MTTEKITAEEAREEEAVMEMWRTEERNETVEEKIKTSEVDDEIEARAWAVNERVREVLGRRWETLGLLEQTGFIESCGAEEGVREVIDVLTRALEEWQERRLMWKIRQMLKRVSARLESDD
jgi:hypothetical protein